MKFDTFQVNLKEGIGRSFLAFLRGGSLVFCPLTFTLFQSRAKNLKSHFFTWTIIEFRTAFYSLWKSKHSDTCLDAVVRVTTCTASLETGHFDLWGIPLTKSPMQGWVEAPPNIIKMTFGGKGSCLVVTATCASF